MPDFDLDTYGCGFHHIQHSEVVIEASRKFSQALQTRPVIGVHIRAEKLVKSTGVNTSACFQQLKSLLQTLTNASEIPNKRVSVFHDLGKYGTMSCNKEPCVSRKSEVLSQINSLGYSILSFDPTMFYSVPVSSALAAFVEREYLMHVDILVTLGTGSFQGSIVKRFLKHSDGNKHKLYRICFF